MSRSGGYRPVVVLRRVLLVLLVLFVGVVVALFIDNRREEAATPPSAGLVEDPSFADLILAGTGFDYEVADGEERLFNIKADRVVTNRQNIVTLEGIVIEVERDSGEIFKLSADAGKFQAKTKTAIVEGSVVLEGSSGVELRGEKFELLRKGKVVKSRAPIEFSTSNGLRGQARELEAYLERDRYQLSGNVLVDGSGGVALRARRILYEPEARLLQAEGGVLLTQGRDELSCRRIAVTLSENGSQPQFVRARWGVVGRITTDDRRGFERRTRFAGDQLSLVYDQNGAPELAEVTGTARTPARFDQGDDTGTVTRFITRRIEAGMSGGQVTSVRAEHPITLTEFLRFDAGRELSRVCGDSAFASFDPLGGLKELTVAGSVNLHRPGVQAIGETLVARGEESVEVVGQPAQVLTADGEVSAPKIEYKNSSGEVLASSGVRATLPADGDFTLAGSSDRSRRDAIQVTSEDALWQPANDLFTFEGDVRAWQGDSYLTAQTLSGKSGKMTGEGGVKTVLERTEEGTGTAKEDGPVEVTARKVVYGEEGRSIVYQGSPEVRQGARNMRCTDLEVFLDDASEVERLECRGDTIVDDRVSGRKVTGSEAVYLPASSTVEIAGNPVVLERPDGAVIRGRRIVYDFETTTAQIRSGSTSDPATGATAADDGREAGQ